jgi:hypothetical protein
MTIIIFSSSGRRRIQYSKKKALAFLHGLFVWLLDLGENQGPKDQQAGGTLCILIG